MQINSEIKHFFEKCLMTLANIMGSTWVGRILCEKIVNNLMNNVLEVNYKNVPLCFTAPNAVNRFRIETFASKEPETLDWIDGFPEGSVLWDVGANVGLYSVYAAKAKGCQVFAFEPSVFNLELLARNIHLNGLTEQVCMVPLALSNRMARRQLNMSTIDWGGALSTFGHEFGWDGQIMNKVFSFQTLGVSMNDAVTLLHMPQPQYIKLDVDGIEHLILRGGLEVLQKVTGVLVEINDAFSEQSEEAERRLREAGLSRKEKRHAEMFEGCRFQTTFNQIWFRI